MAATRCYGEGSLIYRTPGRDLYVRSLFAVLLWTALFTSGVSVSDQEARPPLQGPAASSPSAASSDSQSEGYELSDNARISLITYTPGEELYQAFGHSAIRVKDAGFDVLLNFGTFDFDTPNFYLKFAHGDLLYQLMAVPAEAEMPSIEASGGGVSELVLDLSPYQKQQLFNNLLFNLLPENRFYLYDFVLDNCSTRIRDAFERVTRAKIAVPAGGKRTVRQMLDPYLERIPWVKLGLYLLLGAKADRALSEREQCFLPADLEMAVAAGRNGNHSLLQIKQVLSPAKGLSRAPFLLSPLFVISCVGSCWIIFWVVRGRRFSDLGTAALLILVGAIGTFVFAFSFWTRHWVGQENYNIAWLVPTHWIAGLAILFRQGSFMLVRVYLFVAGFLAIGFCLFSFLLPQSFHSVAYPISILIAWRCFLPVMAPSRLGSGAGNPLSAEPNAKV
ncbi:MAG: DUF4105 domain-containing protein [Verrucomicrobia bacterium]|nr:DUF4105 domain-containing protein [Verrucomicrobiota bacterium]